MPDQVSDAINHLIKQMRSEEVQTHQKQSVKYIRIMRDRLHSHGLSIGQAAIVAWVPKNIAFPHDVDMGLVEKFLNEVIDTQLEMVKSTLHDPKDTDTLYAVMYEVMKDCELDFT